MISIQTQSTRDELDLKNHTLFGHWYFLIRWPVPLAVASILVMGLSE